MVLGGDEFGRTQRGNNNAYCQDNDTSWVDWHLADWQQAQRAFVERLITLRRRFPILRQNRFLTGERNEQAGVKDVTWLTAAGKEITADEWNDGQLRCFGMLIDGRAISTEPAQGDTLLILLNANESGKRFVLPCSCYPRWSVLIDTSRPERAERARSVEKQCRINGQSVMLLHLEAAK